MKNMKSKKLAIISLSLLAIIVLASYINFDQNRRQNPMNISYEEYIKDDTLSLTIERFGEDTFARNNNEKSLCAAKALWEKDVDFTHKVVLGSIFCMEFNAKSGNLKADDSYIDSNILFMLENKENNWQITDYDDRNSEEAPAKNWVSEYSEQVPLDINTKIDKQFLWGKLMLKVKNTLSITTGTYTFKSCSHDSDCDSDEICVLHNFMQDEAANKCVKECSGHEECGVGYLCRKSCVSGENSCNFNSKNICKPFFEMDIQGFTVPNEPF